jgi:Alpha-N-acetylglucosaminidase (NAGLU) N-terminal domain
MRLVARPSILLLWSLLHTNLVFVTGLPRPQLLGEVSAVYDLIDRVLGSATISNSTAASHPFHLQLVHRNESDLFFQLEDSVDGLIRITGTTANELSAGVGWYLRHYCNMTIGWPRGGGSHITIPQQWPKIGTVVQKKRQLPWSYLMVSKNQREQSIPAENMMSSLSPDFLLECLHTQLQLGLVRPIRLGAIH